MNLFSILRNHRQTDWKYSRLFQVKSQYAEINWNFSSISFRIFPALLLARKYTGEIPADRIKVHFSKIMREKFPFALTAPLLVL
jgi:hypothetical protein